MHNEISTPVIRSAGWTNAPASLRSAAVVLAGTLLLAICAHISVPLWFTPVPLSLQPFGVLLLALLLSPRMAVATMLAYLAEGIAGLPVFAPGIPGAAHVFGPTGGYLMAYPAAGFLISLLFRRSRRGFFSAFACAAVGDLLILACGAAWLTAVTPGQHSVSFLTASLLAFLPGDALKAAAAAGISSAWQRMTQRRSR
jgi:biotin transport system substrate-specific component